MQSVQCVQLNVATQQRSKLYARDHGVHSMQQLDVADEQSSWLDTNMLDSRVLPVSLFGLYSLYD